MYVCDTHIHSQFDSDPRAAYFHQSEGGMHVRMALLVMIVDKCVCINLTRERGRV